MQATPRPINRPAQSPRKENSHPLSISCHYLFISYLVDRSKHTWPLQRCFRRRIFWEASGNQTVHNSCRFSSVVFGFVIGLEGGRTCLVVLAD